MSAGEPRRRPVVIEGELAERMLRAMETSVGLIKDVEELKRDRDESRDTLRGTREYDGLVARFRDQERDLKGLRTALDQHCAGCSAEKADRKVSRREWFAIWAGILGTAILALIALLTHSAPQHSAAEPHGAKH